MKRLERVLNHKDKHWVGDGFHVHGIIRPTPGIYEYTNPFIMMDYASPEEFPKTEAKLGVGVHPHKGFETVTFAIQGEVEHRDSSGGGGVIKAGDVQWMTAGKGVVHEEYHSRDFAKNGGIFEMVQLWVNLPKKDKLTEPKYQDIKNENFQRAKKEGYEVKVIAGEFENMKGIASTFSEINIYEVDVKEESKVEFKLKEDTNTAILIIDGEVTVDDQKVKKQNILLFSQDGEEINLNATGGTRLLVLNGTPIEEPIVAHGPFVMNTKQEIIEAIEEYNSGKMGTL